MRRVWLTAVGLAAGVSLTIVLFWGVRGSEQEHGDGKQRILELGDAQRGRGVWLERCVSCHAGDGRAPNLQESLGDVLDQRGASGLRAYVAESIRFPDKVVRTVHPIGMQVTGISNHEIADVVAYVCSIVQ